MCDRLRWHTGEPTLSLRPMHLTRLLLFCLLIPAAGIAATPAATPAPPSEAQVQLEAIIQRQQKLFAQAERAKKADNFDPEQFQVSVQDICYQYNDWLRRHPKIAGGYLAYGLLLAKINMTRESTDMLLKANALDPNIPQVKNQLGNFLAEEGKPIQAASYFLAAIRLDPNEPLYHFQLGTLLLNARDDFLASNAWTRAGLDHTMYLAFKKASELAPDNLNYSYSFASCFYALEEPDWNEALGAWKHVEKLCKPGLEQQTIWLQEANLLIKLGKDKEAKVLIGTVDVPQLAEQKQKLVALLSETGNK